jgi:putative transposase
MSSKISKNHKKYFLKIHLILVCKYRKKLLIGQIEAEIKKYMVEICSQSSFRIDIVETDKDHIHLLLDITPNHSISSIVNRLKSISTNRIWKRYKTFLQKHFWKEKTFWSDGYFVSSIGDANPETVRKYIENQG